jgi:hypothetical protein
MAIVGGLGAAVVAIWLLFAQARAHRPTASAPTPSGPRASGNPEVPEPGRAPTPLANWSAKASEADAGDQAEREGRLLLADSRAAYAACDTYEDDGVYDIAFRGDAGQHTEADFHTVFAGPNAIRFAYRDKADRFFPDTFTQIVVNDAGVQTTLPWESKPETDASLASAVGALRGVSYGLVAAVIPLLRSGVDAPSALDVSEPRLAGPEVIDGTLCDVIEAVEPRSDGTTRVHIRIWIARKDGLVRRRSGDDVWNEDDARRVMRSREEVEAMASRLRDAGLPESVIEHVREHLQKVEPLSTFSTVTYHPRCNEPIAPEALWATDGSL